MRLLTVIIFTASSYLTTNLVLGEGGTIKCGTTCTFSSQGQPSQKLLAGKYRCSDPGMGKWYSASSFSQCRVNINGSDQLGNINCTGGASLFTTGNSKSPSPPYYYKHDYTCKNPDDTNPSENFLEHEFDLQRNF